MRKFLLMLAAGAALSTTARAQVTPEFRPFLGAYVPTGAQSEALRTSMLVGAQVAVEIRNSLHLVGTLAYATPQTDRLAIGRDLHLYQYDVGAEVFRVLRMSQTNHHWTFRPFVGAGLGARTHDFYDRNDTKAQTYFAGYGAFGGEVQHQRVALRVETRDYLTRHKGLTGLEAADARNDLMITTAIVFHAL